MVRLLVLWASIFSAVLGVICIISALTVIVVSSMGRDAPLRRTISAKWHPRKKKVPRRTQNVLLALQFPFRTTETIDILGDQKCKIRGHCHLGRLTTITLPKLPSPSFPLA